MEILCKIKKQEESTFNHSKYVNVMIIQKDADNYSDRVAQVEDFKRFNYETLEKLSKLVRRELPNKNLHEVDHTRGYIIYYDNDYDLGTDISCRIMDIANENRKKLEGLTEEAQISILKKETRELSAIQEHMYRCSGKFGYSVERAYYR